MIYIYIYTQICIQMISAHTNPGGWRPSPGSRGRESLAMFLNPTRPPREAKAEASNPKTLNPQTPGYLEPPRLPQGPAPQSAAR